MISTEARTPLYDWHVAHGGRMVDFAGWSMPIQYTSIVAEHMATRTAVGLFDISHMGRLRFDGADAARFLDSLVTRHVAALPPGHIGYALVTNDEGGTLDDVLIYHLADAAGSPYYLMVVNASNREKIVAWIDQHRDPALDVRWTDVTHDWAMIAVQGPAALALAQPLVEADLARMKYYTGLEARIAGHDGIVSRTGYTGEDGVELIVRARAVVPLWEALATGQGGATPAGLGCRDTLRLEAGMPLYGHELSETIDPFQAGLGFAVQLDKGCHFPGCEALARLRDDRTRPRRVGIELESKRVPRQGFAILASADGPTVGHVTSGTFSPTFEKPLAMGYVAPELTAPGTTLAVDIRGRAEPARVARLPFYRRRNERISS